MPVEDCKPPRGTSFLRASRVYDNIEIVCPCQGGSNADIENVQYVHCMGSMYFCPSCQAPKCRQCCGIHLESRICIGCNSDSADTSTGSVCDKNCYVCPLCTSDLLIHGSNAKNSNGEKGKTFKFSCGFCAYEYVTPVITTPRPLHRIINSERKRDLTHQSLFDLYRQSLSERCDANVSYSDKRHQDEIKQKLSQLNISQAADTNDDKRNRIDIQHDRVLVEQRMKESNISNYFSDIANNSIYNKSTHNKLYPIGKPLTTRTSHSCLTCHMNLASPSAKDPNKFATKWNAIDFIPAVDFTYPHSYLCFGGSSLNECMLHFRNPTLQKIHLNISSPSVVPQCYVSNDNIEVQIAFPISKFSVGPNTEAKDLIQSIPTALLTKNTVQARVEFQERLARKLEQGLEVLDNILESQYNWCLIPLNVSCEWRNANGIQTVSGDTQKVRIKIPLYITISSKLPDSIAQLRLMKTALNYGFWCLIDIGEYSISS